MRYVSGHASVIDVTLVDDGSEMMSVQHYVVYQVNDQPQCCVETEVV